MSPHTNGNFTLPDATQTVACDVPEGMTLAAYRVWRYWTSTLPARRVCAQNRALHRLHREHELRRAQLWTVGVPNVELDALIEVGAIALEAYTDTFCLTPAGEHLLAARGWGPTYTNGVSA